MSKYRGYLKKGSELLVLSSMVGVLLAGCGGGGGSSNSSSTNVSSSSTVVLQDLMITNLDSTGFPWNNLIGNTFPNVDKRWDITTPIPVQINGDLRAGPAMDAIEAKLGMTIFDRTSIASTPASSVTRGLIFSQGTAYAPPGTPIANNCGNVSSAPNSGGYPSDFMVSGSSGVISTVLYVNLDSPVAGGCIATPDVVIHELGHALGMGAHFYGFGDGPAISTDFWSVLATLYGNPIGTPTASMVMIMK